MTDNSAPSPEKKRRRFRLPLPLLILVGGFIALIASVVGFATLNFITGACCLIVLAAHLILGFGVWRRKSPLILTYLVFISLSIIGSIVTCIGFIVVIFAVLINLGLYAVPCVIDVYNELNLFLAVL